MRIGNCTALEVSYKKYLILGPTWPFSVVALTVLCVGTVLVLKASAKIASSIALAVWIHSLSVLILMVCIVLSNPGLSHENVSEIRDTTENDDRIYCFLCNIHQNVGTFHCDVCGCCIKKRHHHCDWIGKCIGEGNIALYKWFTYGWVSYLFFGIVIFSVYIGYRYD